MSDAKNSVVQSGCVSAAGPDCSIQKPLSKQHATRLSINVQYIMQQFES